MNVIRWENGWGGLTRIFPCHSACHSACHSVGILRNDKNQNGANPHIVSPHSAIRNPQSAIELLFDDFYRIGTHGLVTNLKQIGTLRQIVGIQ
jgi:hypothetical protein